MARIVIIGGGFAGSSAAKCLEKDKNIGVTLIDTKDYFEFTPGILRALIYPKHFKRIKAMHSDYLKNTEVINGEVIELKKNSLIVNFKKKKKSINFDYCLISSGSSYDSPIKDYKLVIASRIEEISHYHDRLESAKEVLIIGGGLVGVELAGEILSRYKDKKITIIDPHDRLMDRQNAKAQKYAEKYLRKKAEIILGDKIARVDKGKYFTKNGLKLNPDIAFFCTGIRPNFSFLKKNFSRQLNGKGKIKVNSFLQIKESENIFAAGDICDIDQEALAQNAEIMGKLAASNISRKLKNKKMKRYKAKPRMMVISLGRFNGLITYKNIAISGLIAAFMKWGIETWFMLGLKGIIPWLLQARLQR